jgi:dihydropteroate synthase
MGIVNVTPDSFSDGGEFLAPKAAIAHGLELIGEGADIVDIGGESTRPGAAEVSTDDELERVIPVIEGLAGAGVRISIDTSKAAVAEASLRAGATIVNDVTALGDPEMAAVCASAGAGLILMHMKGTPRTMQENPTYDDLLGEIRGFLAGRLRLAIDAGVPEDGIWLDPGIGFGKTTGHNVELIDRLGELSDLGRPLVLGASRKSFLGELSGRRVDRRLGGSLAASIVGLMRGADVLRVHDVSATREAIEVAEAILGSRPWRSAKTAAGVGS